MMAQLYRTTIVHRRFSPRAHALKARAAYVRVDIERLPQGLRLMGANRRGLFSVQTADHGTGGDLATFIRARGASSGADCSGPVHLLTLPRLLGYVFNPVSVFVCHDADGQPSASLFEVNNFHGERHYYVNRLDPGLERHTHHARKEFHVSPFLALEHTYRFALELRDDHVHFAITEYEGEKPVLYARMAGTGAPLSDRALARAAIAFPLQSFAIVGQILWEAAKLWIKRVPVVPHPGERHRNFTLARKN